LEKYMVTKARIEGVLVLAKLSRLYQSSRGRHGLPAHYTGKEEEMKKLIVALALCLAVAIPSFGVEHVITHSAKVAAKDSYKSAKDSVKETGKFLKFVF
jgi:hypothetical protein